VKERTFRGGPSFFEAILNQRLTTFSVIWTALNGGGTEPAPHAEENPREENPRVGFNPESGC
jgi:hypothetical protein